MPALESIPTEIIMEIFSSLHITDLINSSCVSHHLHAIAETILYKIVSLTYNGASPSRFQTFLRTIVCRPQLGNCVQLLILRWTSEENTATRLLGNNITQSTAVGRAAVPQYGLQPPIKQAIVLLYLLPKLQRLHMFTPGVPGPIFDEFIHGNGSIPNFPAGFVLLQEIKVDWSNSRGALTPTEFFTTFGLPAIRKITIPTVRDIAEIEALNYNSVTRKSSVTELSFGCDIFTGESLGRILRFPRTLIHFSFRYSGISFDAPEFGRALKSTRTTLQQLRLEFVPQNYDDEIGNDDSDSDIDTSADDLDDDDSIYYDSDDNSDEEMTMESLQDWPALRSIRCPLTPLIGVGLGLSQPRLVDVLPIVIVEFVAEVDDYWTAAATAYQVVLMLHQRKQRGLHRLAAVGVVGMGSDLVQRGLRAVCNSAGVKMLEQ